MLPTVRSIQPQSGVPTTMAAGLTVPHQKEKECPYQCKHVYDLCRHTEKYVFPDQNYQMAVWWSHG